MEKHSIFFYIFLAFILFIHSLFIAANMSGALLEYLTHLTNTHSQIR